MERNAFYDNLRLFNEKDSLMHHGILGQKWGVRRYQNPDGSLTEEGKARYLNPDGSISDKAPTKIKSAYNRYQYAQNKKEADNPDSMKDNHVYDENKQKEKMSNATEKHMYDRAFVETIQNSETLDNDDDVNKEYAKYLKNPRKYMQEFDAQAFDKGRLTTASTPAPEKQPAEKKETANTQNEAFKEKVNEILDKKGSLTGEDIAKINKEIGGTKENNKPTKQEKAEIKEAKKAVQKNLDRGIMGNWDLLNTAMKELGMSSADQKNMSAADWNRVNEKIQELKKK